MDQIRKALITGKSISFILVAAILINIFQPVHYHFHHNSSPDSAGHNHSIDLHSVADESHNDEGADIFNATPQGMSKKTSQDTSPLILLALILFVLPFIDSRFPGWVKLTVLRFKQYPSHLSPPLRAPPL